MIKFYLSSTFCYSLLEHFCYKSAVALLQVCVFTCLVQQGGQIIQTGASHDYTPVGSYVNEYMSYGSKVPVFILGVDSSFS